MHAYRSGVYMCILGLLWKQPRSHFLLSHFPDLLSPHYLQPHAWSPRFALHKPQSLGEKRVVGGIACGGYRKGKITNIEHGNPEIFSKSFGSSHPTLLHLVTSL